MPRITSTSGAPDLTVEPKLMPDDIKKMTDAELDAAIERLSGDRQLYTQARANAPSKPKPRANEVFDD